MNDINKVMRQNGTTMKGNDKQPWCLCPDTLVQRVIYLSYPCPPVRPPSDGYFEEIL